MYYNDEKTGVGHNQNGWHSPDPRQPESGAGQPAETSFRYSPDLSYHNRTGPPVAYGESRALPQRPVKKRGIGAGLVAIMLVLSLAGGALGGGVATLYLHSRNIPVEAAGAYIPAVAAYTPPAAEPNPVLRTYEQDVIYAAEKASASVVEITVNTQVRGFFGMRESEGAGSGVILSQDGYIVTNYHVIESGGEIVVRTEDGAEFEAEIIGVDPQTDLAVIKIEASSLPPVEIADSDAVRVGQLAVAIGNPLGTLGGTVTHGIVSAMDREITIDGQQMRLMQTSAAVNPGNSGGGLFDANGHMIGVVNAKGGGVNIEGLGFAIPSNIVRQVTRDLIAVGYVTGRPELGVSLVQADTPQAAAYHRFFGTGVFVHSVIRENGLMAGDRIVAIRGEEVTQTTQVSEAVQASQVGDVIPMTVERDGEIIEVDALVGEHIPESVRESIPQPDDM
ncbi:MAG: trypsin-like peptidase domain-containing protein [Oscillospiraceae bacterium]|nr:trypsin-like peptidase domain-containing protein [Oscillospiraceae bacterium]